MQSGPFEVDQKSSHSSTRNSPDASNQHGSSTTGYFDPHPGIIRGLGERLPTDDQEAVNEDGEASISSIYTRDEDEDEHRLSRTSSGSPSLKDRISQYEADSSPSPPLRGAGLAFKVEKSRGKRTEPSVFKSFPNEVMVHILSHLPPQSLSTAASVSRRFHDLVSTPHAWRDAFAKYFPGQDQPVKEDDPNNASDSPSERKAFDRLTPIASWRTEYILRTHLLRSLARGKPAHTPRARVSSSHASRSRSAVAPAAATATFNSQLHGPIDQIAVAAESPTKRSNRVMHGSNDTGTASFLDVETGKVSNWGVSDPQTFLQFQDRYPGESLWGLGSGDVVGCTNSMDLSPVYGMVHAEGSPGGMLFLRSINAMRGSFISEPERVSSLEQGIPDIPGATETITSLWIAKSSNIPVLSNGMFGILCGSSQGVLTAYSLGTDGLHGERFPQGRITARWVLSPGVPIIGLAIDDLYTERRKEERRAFAVILNALGEVFYLDFLPKRPDLSPSDGHTDAQPERLAWQTGRNAHWKLVEASSRKAKPDPYNSSDFDGGYTPRSSWIGSGQSQLELMNQTREIERYVRYKPRHWQTYCHGWNMQRKLLVDFAGHDTSGAGEAIIVAKCGDGSKSAGELLRYSRSSRALHDASSHLEGRKESDLLSRNSSLFGGKARAPAQRSVKSTEEPNSYQDPGWRVSELAMGVCANHQVTSVALDMSKFALISSFEDPSLSFLNEIGSKPHEHPFEARELLKPEDVPGQRARHIAVGTKSGSVLIWNARAPTSGRSDLVNIVLPQRVIHTDSPQISCLAVSALYIVHGGNDGLVQAWDPLGSKEQPIRTINSRYSSRARRRIAQAEASLQGVGINFFAAGAIWLDPDPTVLRGIVSLGTQLRYWSYSSSAADQYSSRKRRLRQRSERNSNNHGEGRFSATGRGAVSEYIATEKFELEREKEQKRDEARHLAGRYGVGLLGHGESEEEVLAYARLLSQESFAQDKERRRSESESGYSSASLMGGSSSSGLSSATVTPEASVAEVPTSSSALSSPETDDPDIAEAIRRSLGHEDSIESAQSQEPPASSFAEIPIRYAKNRRTSTPRKAATSEASSASHSNAATESDLDYALQLSLAEEQSRRTHSAPQSELEDAPGKGKGKAT